jgi:hypothetical protein
MRPWVTSEKLGRHVEIYRGPFFSSGFGGVVCGSVGLVFFRIAVFAG